MTRTAIAKKQDIEKKWYLIDATDRTLGRLASEVAKILMGKNKSIWTPNVDTGDFVVVINAEKVKVTGRKLDEKIYYRHSGYLGGLKKETLRSLMNRRPETVIMLAVRGMLPKTKLGERMIKKLKVYRGSQHPHQAQNPQQIEL
ncbi:MAG: 50S ribosomal protein L13 [Candidatus Omnitrophica bacterium]|nr:50S ribosomal protein L13 [Candidatus Omnitrophota bacterium]MCM8778106.1 50S ribosomal protein L13 [Candidatus Omnitrophota bacterium]